MTWKERRTITILSAILAVLSAALLIVLGMKYREARAAEDPDAPVPGYVDTQSGEFTSLRYSNGAATLSFVQDANGAWIWADDSAFPLDDTTITTILDTLSAMTPQQTLTAPESLEEYGLDDPDVSLTAGTADGKTFTVAFGKTTTDGKSYYTMLNDDTSTIYIFSGELRRLLDAPIYDMMELPQLPDLNGLDLLSITIQGPAEKNSTASPVVLAAVRPDGQDEEATWRYDGANVTDDKSVQALLEDLYALSVARCVDYRPSEKAASLCGFDAPDAQVSIRYRTGEDAEQTLEFSIGKPLSDGSGRYGRIGADPTIYLFSTELLDPLMRIAVNGLE